jgi:hypothetical protein
MMILKDWRLAKTATAWGFPVASSKSLRATFQVKAGFALSQLYYRMEEEEWLESHRGRSGKQSRRQVSTS